MAWVTYDLIEEVRRSGSTLRREPVFSYLKELGFDVDRSTGSSHMQITTPDEQQKYSIANHGTNPELTMLEIRGVYEMLTDYFARVAAAEAAELKASMQHVEEFPEWLIADGYLAKLGVKLKSEDSAHPNGMHMLTLIDREFPEFSVRVSYDYNGKALTQSAIEGSVKKLRVFKEHYLQLLSDTVTPYETLVMVHRTKRDSGYVYELRDTHTDGYIQEIPIPDMSKEDGAKRDALMNDLINKLGSTLHMIHEITRESDDEVELRRLEMEAKIAKDAAKQKKWSDAKVEREEQAKQLNRQQRAEAFQVVLKDLEELGFDTKTVERDDGSIALELRQREDVMRPLKLLKHLYDLPREPGIRLKQPRKTSIKGKLVTLYDALQSFNTYNPIMSAQAVESSVIIVPFDTDDKEAPASARISEWQTYVSRVKSNLLLSNASIDLLKTKEIDGKQYAVVRDGEPIYMDPEMPKTVLNRKIWSVILDECSRYIQLGDLCDELDQVDMQLLRDGSNFKVVHGQNSREVENMSYNIYRPDPMIFRITEVLVQELLEQDLAEAIAPFGGHIIGRKEGKLHFVTQDGGEEQTLPVYKVHDRNAELIKKKIDALGANLKFQDAWKDVEEKIADLKRYGYSEHKGSWQSPLKVFMPSIPAATPTTEVAAKKRISIVDELLEQLTVRYEQQNTLLDAMRARLGKDAVKPSDNGIELQFPERALALSYAIPRTANGHAPDRLLLDDDSFKALKKLDKGLPPLNAINGGDAKVAGAIGSPQMQK